MHLRRAFTLVEAVVSVLIVGGMTVGALHAVAASKTLSIRAGEKTEAMSLATDLMAEILSQAYEDPAAGSSTLGRDSSEPNGQRDQWNDVDDYTGWSSTPPTLTDGTAIPGYENWTRSVNVQWAKSNNPSKKSTVPTGIKCITVTVTHGSRPVAQLRALRTAAWDTLQ